MVRSDLGMMRTVAWTLGFTRVGMGFSKVAVRVGVALVPGLPRVRVRSKGIMPVVQTTALWFSGTVQTKLLKIYVG